MRTMVLTLAFTVIACGTDEKSTTENPGATTPELAPAKTESPAQTTDDRYAMLVADASALPPCDAAVEGRLAYVKADKTFQVCISGVWGPIDLRGADGAPGKDGSDGKDGADGAAGKDGVAASANTWLDPITGKTWLVGGTAMSPTGCGGEWRLPTFAEITKAAQDGMHAGFAGVVSGAAYECALHSDGGFNVNSTVGESVNCAVRAGPYGIYCVKI